MTATDRNDATAVAACDPRALSVARAVHEREQPLATILFGSRARGDYEEGCSDIDIMLLNPGMPDHGYKDRASQWAEGLAQSTYGRPVPVQLVWRTTEDFRRRRRYVNSVETRAVHDGVLMARDPKRHGSTYYEDEETECEYDWMNYNNRLFHAESHLDLFNTAIETGKNDLMIGQQAQAALEHGMKALLEAHRVSYQRTHNIGHLLGRIRRTDPQLPEFAISIAPDIYTKYAGEQAYELSDPLLTDHPDYRQRTIADAQRIINRAREVRQDRTD
jgi:HEPN domain-containing protein